VAPRDETQPPTSFCPIEAIAQAYLVTTTGNEGQALRIAITDALADLMEGSVRGRGVNSRTALAGIGVAIGPCG
jgi:hypothetical protein